MRHQLALLLILCLTISPLAWAEIPNSSTNLGPKQSPQVQCKIISIDRNNIVVVDPSTPNQSCPATHPALVGVQSYSLTPNRAKTGNQWITDIKNTGSGITFTTYGPKPLDYVNTVRSVSLICAAKVITFSNGPCT